MISFREVLPEFGPFPLQEGNFLSFDSGNLLDHTVSVHWKENLLIAATVVAVCLFAISFFLGMTHLYIPFGLFAIANAIGAYTVHDAVLRESMDRLKAIVDETKEQSLIYGLENAAHRRENEKHQRNNAEYAAKLKTMESFLSRMGNTLSSLEATPTGIAKAQKDLGETHAAVKMLHTDIAKWLRDAHGGLDAKIQALVEKLEGLRCDDTFMAQVKNLQAVSEQVAKTSLQLGVVQGEVGQLTRVREELTSCIQDLRTEVSRIQDTPSVGDILSRFENLLCRHQLGAPHCPRGSLVASRA